MRRLLLELVLERPAIAVMAPARLAGLERRCGSHRGQLDDGRCLQAALIVGADGRASTVRTRAGLDGSSRQYGQTALTFALRHDLPHDGRVREFLRPAGPLALLPIGAGPIVRHVDRGHEPRAASARRSGRRAGRDAG